MGTKTRVFMALNPPKSSSYMNIEILKKTTQQLRKQSHCKFHTRITRTQRLTKLWARILINCRKIRDEEKNRTSGLEDFGLVYPIEKSRESGNYPMLRESHRDDRVDVKVYTFTLKWTMLSIVWRRRRNRADTLSHVRVTWPAFVYQIKNINKV